MSAERSGATQAQRATGSAQPLPGPGIAVGLPVCGGLTSGGWYGHRSAGDIRSDRSGEDATPTAASVAVGSTTVLP